MYIWFLPFSVRATQSFSYTHLLHRDDQHHKIMPASHFRTTHPRAKQVAEPYLVVVLCCISSDAFACASVANMLARYILRTLEANPSFYLAGVSATHVCTAYESSTSANLTTVCRKWGIFVIAFDHSRYSADYYAVVFCNNTYRLRFGQIRQSSPYRVLDTTHIVPAQYAYHTRIWYVSHQNGVCGADTFEKQSMYV